MEITKIPVCQLCREREADPKKAHIVPKFLTKSLFSDAPARQAIRIDKNRRQIPIQDTFKESYFLCIECEKKFEVIETYMSRKIQDIFDWKSLPNGFEYKVSHSNRIIECLTIPDFHIKAFLYSIIWRISASKKITKSTFTSFKLNAHTENVIRQFLLNSLGATKKTLESNIRSATLPGYYLCLFKPEDRLYPPKSSLTAASKHNVHLVSLVDFFLMFYINKRDIPSALLPFTNSENSNFKVILSDKKHWIMLNNSVTPDIQFQE